jgi:hypothetical protein
MAKKALKQLAPLLPRYLLDVATSEPCDVAIMAASELRPDKIIVH